MFTPSFNRKTDEELMTLIASGNERALTELYNRYSKLMVRYFFRMLWKDEARAQDFLQDLFVKILERPEYFDTTKRFSTWVYSVAHNMCKNEYRREMRRNTKNLDDHEVVMLVHSSSQEEEFRRNIERAVNLLDEESKHLYALRYDLELPLEEIADLLMCPLGTVKSRVFHLKKKLAIHLQEDYPELLKYGKQ
jgi:RNA polymerase sigma-70 factor, ECF subfamily